MRCLSSAHVGKLGYVWVNVGVETTAQVLSRYQVPRYWRTQVSSTQVVDPHLP